MAKNIIASDVVVKIDNIVVGCAQTAEFTVSREMLDSTCTATGAWKAQTPGQKSWTGSFSAIFREFTVAEAATNVSFDDVFDLVDDGTLVTIEYATTPNGVTRYSGEAYVSEIKFSKPEKDSVTWSASYQGNGPLTRIP
jgi:hypothetical protein